MHRFNKWREALQAAGTEDQVLGVLGSYVGSISPQVLEILPSACQKALEDKDAMGAAVTLLQEELRYQGNPEVAAILHEIAHTFAAASTRLTRIRREPIVPAED